LKSTSPKITPEKLFDELKTLAETIGVQVIVDKGNFSGGHCIVYEQRKIVVNKILPTEVKVAKLAQSLSFFSFDDVALPPALRNYLQAEQERAKVRANGATTVSKTDAESVEEK
jgi:hypothetical protein